MAGFWNFIKDLLSRTEESHPGNPAIHEVIERSQEEQQTYIRWRNSTRKVRALKFLQLEYKKNIKEENLLGATFYTIDNASTKGFQLNFRYEFFSPAEFRHLLDYFKEKILELEYRIYISDRKAYHQKGHYIETERHYLKPRHKVTIDKKQLHQYGNITIQTLFIDGKPDHLKFFTTIYSDKAFSKAKDYHELIEKILNP